MGNYLHYHHPEHPQYSLAYVTTDREQISPGTDDYIIEQYELDEDVFVLYTNHGTSGTVDELDEDFEAALDAMSREDRQITISLLQIFEEITEQKQTEEDEKLRIYKQIELSRVPEAIAEVEWSRAAVAVAGQLMSTLILKHALPNANHRTSIGLSQWYLESIKTGFSFPDFATEDYEWKRWVDEYIADSKRILTVRRNTTAFSLLAEWGCDVVKRKNDIEIALAEYNLDLPQSEAYAHYGEMHTDRCTEFIIESVKRAGHEELLSIDGVSKTEFARYLEGDT